MALSRRDFLKNTAALSIFGGLPPRQTPLFSNTTLPDWKTPPLDCRPHTRWWWPGNAVSREGIQTQLTAMKAAGLGGAEIVSTWQTYEKGNLSYLSKDYFEMLEHAAQQAQKLNLTLSICFGAGGNLGGSWVPPQERSKCLAPIFLDVEGPKTLDVELPPFKLSGPVLLPGQQLDGTINWQAADQAAIIAVIAAPWNGSQYDLANSIFLTDRVKANHLNYALPAGTWRICAFRLQYTGQANSFQNDEPINWCIDHFSKQAVRNYVAYVGGQFTKRLGKYFGVPIESFLAESGTLSPLPNTLLWSNNTLTEFNQFKGYDLTPYLPALWLNCGATTAKVRYDVNDFLHQQSKDIFYGEFISWCTANRVQARIQLHSLNHSDMIELAGLVPQIVGDASDLGSETLIATRKAIVSGARFAKPAHVSTSTLRPIHRERYRTTLEEVKRAADEKLRDGATKLYQHDWVYSEEEEITPSRDLPWANHLQPQNPLFKHLRGLNDYIARCSWLLKQGQLVTDVLVYAPQARLWSEQVIGGSRLQSVEYGDLPQTLLSNGYDFDLINDELFQNQVVIERDGSLNVRGSKFRVLILPKVTALPLDSLRKLLEFADNGGQIIALDEIPHSSVGLKNAVFNDAAVTELSASIFKASRPTVTFLSEYKLTAESEKQSPKPNSLTPVQKRLLEKIRATVKPDCSLPDLTPSSGLTFTHRRTNDRDIYFLTNQSPSNISTTVTLKTIAKRIELWDAMTGEIRPLPQFRALGEFTEIPLTLTAWDSLFLVFHKTGTATHILQTDLAIAAYVTDKAAIGFAERPGEHSIEVAQNFNRRTLRAWAPLLPEAMLIRGNWSFEAKGINQLPIARTMKELKSWTESIVTRHLAGEGVYEIAFEMPTENLQENLRWLLDLGAVAEVAEVTLNQKRIGVRWMQPFIFDVTRELKPERNLLRVTVTNTLHNRIIGMNAETQNEHASFSKRYGLTNPAYKLGLQALLDHDLKQPLITSGLLGPVTIIPQGIVPFRL